MVRRVRKFKSHTKQMIAKYKRKKKKYSALKRYHSKFHKQVCKVAFKHSATMDHNTLKANHNRDIHKSDTLRNLQQEYFDQASQQHAWQEKYTVYWKQRATGTGGRL